MPATPERPSRNSSRVGADLESTHLEYEATLRTHADGGEVYRPLETAVLKTNAAFLNSRDRGTLLIGVGDVCRVRVDPCCFPVDVEVIHDRNGQYVKQTEFFVRIANGTKALGETEKQRYINQRWGAA